jgi:hypothetical protein
MEQSNGQNMEQSNETRDVLFLAYSNLFGINMDSMEK